MRDYRLESFDGALEPSARWVWHDTRHDLEKMIRKADRMSKRFPKAVFRVIPSGEKVTLHYFYDGGLVAPRKAQEVINFDVARYAQVPAWRAYQWAAHTGYMILKDNGSALRLGNEATIEAWRSGIFSSGLFVIEDPLDSQSGIYVLNGRYIAKDDAESFIAEHTQAQDARALWILPPGHIIEGLNLFTRAVQSDNLKGFTPVFEQIERELISILGQGNIKIADRNVLKAVTTRIEECRRILEEAAK